MQKILNILIITGSIIFISCENDNTSTLNPENNISQNLINNPNFEENGDPTCKYWHPYPDSSYMEISDNTPKNTENWSLKVFGASTQGAMYSWVDTYIIIDSSGINNYQLSAFIKNFFKDFPGRIIIGIKNGYDFIGNNINQSDTIISDTITSWKLYQLNTTLTLKSNDTIIVRLWPSINTGNFASFSLFDIILLKKVSQ